MSHLHDNYSFTESLVETVIRSLRNSCRSELTRQGTSLSFVTLDLNRGAGRFRQPLHVAMQLGLYLHEYKVPSTQYHVLRAWRIVSEDSEERFNAILAYSGARGQ